MPKKQRTSLWPETLGAPGGFDFKTFLSEQARDLERLVDGAFEVVVDLQIVETLFSYKFVMVLPKRDYRYELFSIRTIGGDFPAQIVAGHMPGPAQIVRVFTADELKQELKTMFGHETTIRVVLRLAEEERSELAQD